MLGGANRFRGADPLFAEFANLVFLGVAETPNLWLSNANAIAKIAAFFCIWLIVWLPIAIPIARTIKWHPPQPLLAEQKLYLLLPLYLIAPALLWGIVQVEGSSFAEYGLSLELRFGQSLGIGLVLGVVSLALLFGLQSLCGWVTWQFNAKTPLRSIGLTTLLLGLWVSGTEELIFRGFLLTQLQSDYSHWIAASVSGLIFALLHLIWTPKETFPQLLGLWIMGIVLAIARWVDGDLISLAWGLHAGWVWVIASLETAQVLEYTPKAPVWIAGFGGKPLAGLMGIGLLLLVALGLKGWSVYF